MTASLRFPKPESIALRNFSLYDQERRITAEFGAGVFCLAGANGLGKSTFLAALNFAITGIVANPNQRFDSVEEFYRYSQTFSAGYFHGRIKDRDAADAEVALTMHVGPNRFEMTRGMFEPQGLRSLRVTNAGSNSVILDGTSLSDSGRHDEYMRRVTSDVGLRSFAQLVFLQHFIFTFDERRRLVFWDEKVAQTALFMTFGVDLDHALNAEKKRRAAERADSSARNLQWQVTGIRERLKELQAVNPEAAESGDDIVAQHRHLLEDQQELLARHIAATSAYADAEVQHSDALAQFRTIEAEYQEAFQRRYGGRTPIDRHPLVSATIESNHCGLCGANSAGLGDRVKERVHFACPLCGSVVPDAVPVADEGDLLALDQRLAKRAAILEEAQLASERTRLSLEGVKAELDVVAGKLATFELANQAVLGVREASDSPLDLRIAQLRAEIADLQAKKKDALARRDVARKEFKELSEQLARTYADAEASFVPLFNELAHEFLGLDLEVALQSQGMSPTLVLTVQEAPRRQHEALSESQRYFLDIALRMALVRQMADPDGACLYIDTPEGSLDIAYESRAGSMFGRFVRLGHQLIMTANINSSQLLRRLAETCGPEHMKLLRMTDWTSLTEVQADEEELFNDAYTQIEERLKAGGQ